MVQNKKQTRKVIETKSEGSTNKSDIEMKSEEDTKEDTKLSKDNEIDPKDLLQKPKPTRTYKKIQRVEPTPV